MNMKILLIDDDEAIRKSFALTLRDAGFHVDLAASGTQGLECLQQHSYDLIFLDLKMPGMNGCETLFQIRKINPDIPVYIITAFHEEYLSDLERLTDKNISFELLKKPIDSENLIALTKSVFIEPQLIE